MTEPSNKGISKRYFYKIILIDALALFAMFFGAGNMLFPLEVGVHSGMHFWLSWLGFILTGVGIPGIGLYANHLYKGDYVKLFSHLGRIPEFILIAAIILIIGPLFGAPRTETVSFASLRPFLPPIHGMNAIVSAIYFGLVFFIARSPATLVDIVGEILSPIKIIAFFTLIVLAIWLHPVHHGPHIIQHHAFFFAASVGYQTMDLFGALFFGSIIYLNVIARSKALSLTPKQTTTLAGRSSLIGLSILALVYTGLMIAAHMHAHALLNHTAASLIEALADDVLGKYGAIFVAACITLACLATASALAEVTTQYFEKTLFKNKVPRMVCLSIAVLWMYAMSLLGFHGIMMILAPILNIFYPLIAVYTLIACLVFKVKGSSNASQVKQSDENP